MGWLSRLLRLDSAPELPALPPPRMSRMDQWVNEVTGQGLWNAKGSCTQWEPKVGQDRYVLENIYEHSAIAARIVDKEPQDALRHGFLVPELSEEQATSLDDYMRRRQFLRKFGQARKWERQFGGALLFMDIRDGRPIDEPVNMQSIVSVGQLTPLSRYDVTVSELTSDPLTGELVVPAFYDISATGTRIHPSRVIRFGGIQLSLDRMTACQGWGGSEIDRVWESLMQYGSMLDSLLEAISRITQGVFTSEALARATNSEDCSAVQDRIDALGQWMSQFGDVALGPGETYQVVQRGVQGYRDAAEIYVQALVAETDMPRSILMGETPGGLNSGENAGDWQAWTSHLAGVQTGVYEPRISQFLGISFASAQSPIGEAPDRWSIEWPPLFEIGELDSSTVLTQTATAAVALNQQGLITTNEVRSNPTIAGAFPPQADTVVASEEADPEEEPEIIELAGGMRETLGGDENLQRTALNGAQVQALQEVIDQVASGVLDPDAAVELLKIAFPKLADESIRRLITAARRSTGSIAAEQAAAAE